MEEQRLTWRKSSYSGTNGDCVEVAMTAGKVLVRDTKDREGGTLNVSPEAWSKLISGVQVSPLN